MKENHNMAVNKSQTTVKNLTPRQITRIGEQMTQFGQQLTAWGNSQQQTAGTGSTGIGRGRKPAATGKARAAGV